MSGGQRPFVAHLTLYQILEETQRGTLDITAWLDWFLRCLATAMFESEQLIQSVVQTFLATAFPNVWIVRPNLTKRSE